MIQGIQKIGKLYQEGYDTIHPGRESKKELQYRRATRDIPKVEKERKGVKELLGRLFGAQTETPEIGLDEKFRIATSQTKTALDDALKKNKYNLRTDVLDVVPISVLETGNRVLIALGILAYAVSIHGSIREYRHRKYILEPRMKEVRELYAEIMGEEYSETHDTSKLKEKLRNSKFGRMLLDNFDFKFDVAESVLEVVSILIPGILIPGLGSPLLEIPLDASARDGYYDKGDELALKYNTVNNKDSN